MGNESLFRRTMGCPDGHGRCTWTFETPDEEPMCPVCGTNLVCMRTTPLASLTTPDLLDGIRDALADLHDSPGTSNGEPRDGCPGCEAQAMVDELAYRLLK